MKKKLVMLSLFCLTAWLFSAAKSASADIFFQLSNESGKTFKEIWVGPSSNRKWLPRDRFENNDGTPLRLRSGYHMNLWPNMVADRTYDTGTLESSLLTGGNMNGTILICTMSIMLK